VKEFQLSGGEEFGADLGNRWTLETISSTETILACLRPWLTDLETRYIPWFLSGVEGIGVNHSIYARCVGGCAACEDCVDGNISEITAAGI
jgi:hypothetical protein